MKIEQLKVGIPYKFDNKEFRKKRPSCYGIDIVDAEILFNNSVLIFSDVKYFYSGRGLSNVFLGLEDISKVGIYMKGFKHYNGSAYENYSVKLWYVNLDFFDYLEKYYSLIQEEMEI